MQEKEQQRYFFGNKLWIFTANIKKKTFGKNKVCRKRAFFAVFLNFWGVWYHFFDERVVSILLGLFNLGFFSFSFFSS